METPSGHPVVSPDVTIVRLQAADYRLLAVAGLKPE